MSAASPIKVCAWCPDVVRRPQEAAARARGVSITHGICPRCAAALRAELVPLPLAAMVQIPSSVLCPPSSVLRPPPSSR